MAGRALLIGSAASLAVACSLVIDTSGLSGDAPADDGGRAADVSAEVGDAAEPDARDAAPGSLGPVWLAYGDDIGRIGVRSWQGASWSAELLGPSVGGDPVRWVVPQETPLGSFLAIVSAGTKGHLDVFERVGNSSWQLGFTVPMQTTDRRAFDIAYESGTGSVMVVYGGATPAPKFRRRTTAGWSDEKSLASGGGGGAPLWIELAQSPIGNEILCAFADDSRNLTTSTWNGTSWSALDFVEGYMRTEEFKVFDAAYDVSGRAMLVWGRQSPMGDGGVHPSTEYTTRPLGGSFTAGRVVDSSPAGPIVLAAEPGARRFALSYLEYYDCPAGEPGCDDLATAIWSNGWTQHGVDGDENPIYRGRPATAPTGVAWLGASGAAVAAWHRYPQQGQGLLGFVRYDGNTGSWSNLVGATTNPPLLDRTSMQLKTVPGSRVVAIIETIDGQLWSKTYAGTAWTDSDMGVPLAKNLAPTSAVPFGITAP